MTCDEFEEAKRRLSACRLPIDELVDLMTGSECRAMLDHMDACPACRMRTFGAGIPVMDMPVVCRGAEKLVKKAEAARADPEVTANVRDKDGRVRPRWS